MVPYTKMETVKYYILALVACMAACKPAPYVPAQRTASDFNYCLIERHGHYYDHLSSDVMSIDLYSEGLALDSLGYVRGTGTNLYLSDVFVAPGSTRLPDGTYTADSLGRENTFLPGRDYEGQVNGAYILLVADGKVGSITLCTDSTMCVTTEGDTLDIRFRLRKADGRLYTAHYRGIPEYQTPD